MAGNFLKYAGPLNWSDLPVDSHELIALCAPRPVFIGVGATNGDGWADAKGMFMAAAAAGPLYRLLGKKDLGTSEFPPSETALVSGDVAFRQHSGGHTPAPNWPIFLAFAARFLPPAPQRCASRPDRNERRKVSLIATYGVDTASHLILRRQIVFPLPRTLPNDTHASLSYFFADEAAPRILLDGKPASGEIVCSFSNKRFLTIRSVLGRERNVSLTRALFSSHPPPNNSLSKLLLSPTLQPNRCGWKSNKLKKLRTPTHATASTVHM